MDVKRRMIIRKETILDGLFYTSIFLFPIDSFPLFPTDNVYRPISVIVLMVYMLVFLFSTTFKRVRKHDISALLLVLLFVFHTILTAFFVFGEYGHIPKAVITLTLALTIAVTTNDFFSRHKNKLPIDTIIRVLKASFLLCAIVGLIQFLAIIGIFPKWFSETVTGLFSYRSTGRMQMLSGEPAMMFRNLLIFLVFFIGVKDFSKRKVYLFLVFFFLLISGSTFGYSITVFGILLYLLLFKFNLFLKPVVFFAGILFVLIFFVLYENFLDDYTVKKIDLVVSIVSDPELLSTYLKKDGSFFQRFVNPLIGFKAATYSYGLGSGLDTYRYLYPKYILSDYPYAMSFFSVKAAVEGVSYITPKSIYAKIICELGVIALLSYIGFLGYNYFKVKSLPLTNNKFFLEIMFVLIILFGINNDSIIYVNLYFVIYFFFYLLRSDRLKAKYGD